MRKILILLCCVTFFIACKKTTNNEKPEVEQASENLTKIQAEFIYIQDAAVLKGQSFIYGVVLDENSKELAEKVKPFKKDKFDMVPVVVKGLVKPNPVKDGWKEVVEIKEIVKISPVKGEKPSDKFKVSVSQ